MRLALERRAGPTAPALLEVVTPRTNEATLAAAENLIAALPSDGPVALEIAATTAAQRFLVRAGGPAARRQLEEQLAAAYPQAGLRRLDATDGPDVDPARPRDGERVAACALVLRAPPYLPLRTFVEDDARARRPDGQADPVLGVLAALGDLPPGWRALSQLVLRPAPDDWARPYLRLALEHPLASERAAARGPSLVPVAAMAGLLLLVALGLRAHGWYLDRDWPRLAALGAGVLVGVPAMVWLVRRLTRRALYDPRLVQEKVGPPACRAELRLAVFAPAGTPAAAVAARLARAAGAYRQYTLSRGNGFVPRPLRPRPGALASLDHLLPARAVPLLNTRELAGLWHLPRAGAEAPRVERTTARERPPLPAHVAEGCRIGVCDHQGRDDPVAVPEELLRRHLLLIAKTRRGKSTLLLRMAEHLMAAAEPDGARPALVVVDPHRDLAEAVLARVPAAREGDVVYLDAADRDRPFGVNLLDVGLGWDRDRAVDNTLLVFQRQFDRFWGPRMEDCFRWTLRTLYEANRKLFATKPHEQHTVLAVPAVLTEPPFRRSLVKEADDEYLTVWWERWDAQDRRLQLDSMNPVLTKIHRYAGSDAARALVGQPCSTVDPAAWLREGRIVVLHTARGVIGDGTAALVGGTLLNLVRLAVANQAALPASARRPVTLLVDEFHTMPGADYESILSELAKYRANLVLATQSLARLDALDREHQRALKATVFANIDGLFAFNVSAEDARYLARELDDEWVAEQDLVSLGEHRCFVRASQAGQRPPAHSVHLDRPSEGNDERRDGIVRDSRARYGRALADVEAGLKAALQRVVDCRKPVQASNSEGDGTGAAKDGTTGGPGATAGPHRGPARNENRPQRPRPDPRQTTYLADADASTPDAPAAETTEPAEEAEDAA